MRVGGAGGVARLVFEHLDGLTGDEAVHALFDRGVQVLLQPLLEAQAVRNQQVGGAQARSILCRDLERMRVGSGPHEGHHLDVVAHEFVDDIAQDVGRHHDERAIAGGRRAGGEDGRCDPGHHQRRKRCGPSAAHRPVSASREG